MIKKNSFSSKYVNVPANSSYVHLADGRFLHEEQTLDKAKSLTYQAGFQRPAASKTEGRNLVAR
jgi:hypothetical protein